MADRCKSPFFHHRATAGNLGIEGSNVKADDRYRELKVLSILAENRGARAGSPRPKRKDGLMQRGKRMNTEIKS
jgi:hypothetical protein